MKAAQQSFWHVLPGKRSAGVTDNIKNDCIPFKWAGSMFWCCARWLTVMVDWDTWWDCAVVNAVCSTRAFSAMTSQTVSSRKGLFKLCKTDWCALCTKALKRLNLMPPCTSEASLLEVPLCCSCMQCKNILSWDLLGGSFTGPSLWGMGLISCLSPRLKSDLVLINVN